MENDCFLRNNLSIRILRLHDPEELERVVRLFGRSYQVEADLLGLDDFPPLRRSQEDFASCGHEFVGVFLGDQLAAAVELSWETPSCLSLDSLVVDPDFFRRGLARSLIQEVIETKVWTKVVVETAVGNRPAINLYLSLGFRETRRFWVTDTIEKVAFERDAS